MNLLAAVGLSFLGAVVALFPRRFELWLGPKLGRLFLALDKKRRSIAEENMRRCLPDLTAAQRRALLVENFEHYGILALELLHIFAPFPGHYHAYCRRITVIEGLEHWKAASAKGKGVIVMTGHFANWEAMGRVCTAGIDILMATRPLKPKWVHDRVNWARNSFGQGRSTYGKRILPDLIRQLKTGASIGFVFDQYAPPPMGVPATFFGVTVDTQGALGLIVQRTGAAIVPLHQIRGRDGIIRLRFLPEVSLDGVDLADASATASLLAGRIEAMIREAPAQWLWVHRRFKNVVWPSPAQV